MASMRTWSRRAGALLACGALTATLPACDGDAGSRSSGTTTTSRRRPHRSTTTSSSSPSGTSSTSGTPGTTAPTLPPTTAPPVTGTCGAQAATISALVNGNDLPGVPVDGYTVSDCRLAPSQPFWGALTLSPKPGQSLPKVTVVVEQLGSIWSVHSYGTGATGCDAPATVRAELGLGC